MYSFMSTYYTYSYTNCMHIHTYIKRCIYLLMNIMAYVYLYMFTYMYIYIYVSVELVLATFAIFGWIILNSLLRRGNHGPYGESSPNGHHMTTACSSDMRNHFTRYNYIVYGVWHYVIWYVSIRRSLYTYNNMDNM